jgi:hypothetical protein
MITMTRIPPPAWAPPYAQHVTGTMGDLGEQARAAITPLLPQIYEELHRRVNEFVNDPDQCFDDEENFPARGALNGRYYIEGESHEGNSRENCFRLWVQVRCLEKSDDAGAEQGQDYLGLEAIVTVERDGSGFEFDEGFNTSCVRI